jgi:predicted RNA-binding Zn ribbon-like protein
MTIKARLTQARQRKLQFQNNVSPLDGGTPALNFVNTLKNKGSDNPKDYLTNYEDFVYWCCQAGVISYDYYRHLSLEGYCYAQEAKSVFEQVVTARFILYELFLSVVKNEPADEIFVRQFNSLTETASKYLRYESTSTGLQQVWFNIDEEIAAPLWIIVRSAAGLLVLGDPKKIKQCKTCGSMFLDRTKNGKRRWCNPVTCGKLLRNKLYYHASKRIKEVSGEGVDQNC